MDRDQNTHLPQLTTGAPLTQANLAQNDGVQKPSPTNLRGWFVLHSDTPVDAPPPSAYDFQSQVLQQGELREAGAASETLQPAQYQQENNASSKQPPQNWAAEASRVAARNAFAKQNSKSSTQRPIHKRTRSKKVPKPFAKTLRPGIKVDTSVSRHQGSAPRELFPGSEFANGAARAQSIRGDGKHKSQEGLMIHISPSDRAIPIGLEVPQTVQRDLGAGMQERSSRGDNGSATPTIVITPAREDIGWTFEPITGMNLPWRPASSIYSRPTTYFGATQEADAPPVPALPPIAYAQYSQASGNRAASGPNDKRIEDVPRPPHLLKENRDSTMTAFEEDDDIKPRARIGSTATLFEEDSRRFSLPPQSTQRPGELTVDTIVPTPRRSQGWWNVITTPFELVRSPFKSPRNPFMDGDDAPPVPVLQHAAPIAGAGAHVTKQGQPSSFSPQSECSEFSQLTNAEEYYPRPDPGYTPSLDYYTNERSPTVLPTIAEKPSQASEPSDKDQKSPTSTPTDKKIGLSTAVAPPNKLDEKLLSPASTIMSDSPMTFHPNGRPRVSEYSLFSPNDREVPIMLDSDAESMSASPQPFQQTPPPFAGPQRKVTTMSPDAAAKQEPSRAETASPLSTESAFSPGVVEIAAIAPFVSAKAIEERPMAIPNPPPAQPKTVQPAGITYIQSTTTANIFPSPPLSEPKTAQSAGITYIQPTTTANLFPPPPPIPPTPNDNTESHWNRERRTSSTIIGVRRDLPDSQRRINREPSPPTYSHHVFEVRDPQHHESYDGFRGTVRPKPNRSLHIEVHDSGDRGSGKKWTSCLKRKKDPKPKGEKTKKQKRRRCCFICCLIFGLLAVIALIVALAVTLTRKSSSSSISGGTGGTSGTGSSTGGSSTSNPDDDGPVQWMNVSGYPPMPTGALTIARPDLRQSQPNCINPTTMWSCAVPKEQQDALAPNNPDQPNFRLEIIFNNASSTKSGSSVVSDPSPPSLDDQKFLGNTSDGNQLPFEGDATPFFISLLPTTTTSSRMAKRDPNPLPASTSDFPSVVSAIPSPDVNTDGTAAAANLLSFPSAQPLRIFDRGQPTEHYGFYTYFDRSIFLKNRELANGTTSVLQNIPADEDGGSTFDSASVRCTWAQTRLLVQIWTNKGNNTSLLPAPAGSSTTTASGSKATSSASTSLIRPGTFPYPVTITIDRHGGDISKKLLYCYGMDDSGRIIVSQKKVSFEDKSVGGTIVNPTLGLFSNTTVDPKLGGLGGIDGGTGGCSCRWENFQ